MHELYCNPCGKLRYSDNNNSVNQQTHIAMSNRNHTTIRHIAQDTSLSLLVGDDILIIVLHGGSCCGCLAINLPTEGRVFKRSQCSFVENSHGAGSFTILKRAKTRQGQKSKSGPVLSLPLLHSQRQVWCDFLNTGNERSLIFIGQLTC